MRAIYTVYYKVYISGIVIPSTLENGFVWATQQGLCVKPNQPTLSIIKPKSTMDNTGTIKISKLIEQLQEILKKEGDLPVYSVEFGGVTDVGGASVDTIFSPPDKKKKKKEEKIVVIE